jgi:hypothetical protein
MMLGKKKSVGSVVGKYSDTYRDNVVLCELKSVCSLLVTLLLAKSDRFKCASGSQK